MPIALALDSVVTVAPDQVSSEVGDEEVILNLQTGRYYGLQGVGPRVWSLLKEPRSISQLCDAVVAEYEVDRARCEQDLLSLLSQLAGAQLIEVVHATGDDTATPEPR